MKKYIAIPCAGLRCEPTFKIPGDHVYKIIDDPEPGNSDTEDSTIRWMTLDEAIRNFGENNIFVSPSSTRCPACGDLVRNRKQVLSGNISVRDILEKYPKIIGDKIDDYISP